MPATSPVTINFNVSGSKDNTESSFVNAFATMANAAPKKGMNLVLTENKNSLTDKNKVTSITATLGEGSQSPKEVLNSLRDSGIPGAAYIYSIVTKKSPKTSIKNSMSMENLYEAFDDIAHEIFRLNTDQFKTVEQAKAAMVKQFKLDFNLSDDEIVLDSDLFRKIWMVLEPSIATEKDAQRRAILEGGIIAKLRNLSEATDAGKALIKDSNGKKALLKRTQLRNVADQAQTRYIAFDGVKAVLSKVSNPGKIPGRRDIVEGSTKHEDHTFFKIGECVYDRTRNSVGAYFKKAEKKEVSKALSTNEGVTIVSRAAVRAKFSDEEEKLISNYKASGQPQATTKSGNLILAKRHFSVA